MHNFIRTSLCAVTVLSLSSTMYADGVGIADVEITPDASAMLEVASTNRGVLFPRMSTAQRLAITSAATGLLVFDTDEDAYYFKNTGGWEALVSGGGTPAGGTIAFSGPTNNVPDGWLLCDGSAVRSNDYPNLYAAIGTSWGDASDDAVSETNFRVPDMRGYFLRGVDHGEGNDPDAAERTNIVSGGTLGDDIGTYQFDAFQNITGTVSAVSKTYGSSFGQASGVFEKGAPILGDNTPVYETVDGTGTFTLDASRVARTSTETRPKNVGVNYIIKY